MIDIELINRGLDHINFMTGKTGLDLEYLKEKKE